MLPNVHHQLLGLVQEPTSQVPTTGKTTAKVFLVKENISQNHLTDDDDDDVLSNEKHDHWIINNVSCSDI